MKVLVVGSGGREHCLVWKISQSSLVDRIYCAPGNGGTSLLAQNVNISAEDINGLLRFALEKNIDLTVVGPEMPLVEGIVNRFEEKKLKIFGPSRELAFLEGSKAFAKKLMKKYNVPTAAFEIFDNPDKAKGYVRAKTPPLVIKADGLAAGKGVIVCESLKEAIEAINLIMVDKKFGRSGDRIVVEDFIKGEEASILVFTDGVTIVPLVSSKDHKRIFDGDKGLNTGGMGAYSPAPLLNEASFDKVIKKVFTPLIEGLRRDGKFYKGILYAGLMITDDEYSVLEFNVRFGDPETQAILPKLRSDLVQIMLSTVNSELKGVKLEWDEGYCLCVVLASGGYPGNYSKGKEIKGLDSLRGVNDVFAFHAGTKLFPSLGSGACNFATNGGRVLDIAGLGATIKEAQDKTYRAIKNINFEKMYYRRDIGDKALKI